MNNGYQNGLALHPNHKYIAEEPCEELVQSQNSRTEHTDSHSNLPKHLGETIDGSDF